MRNVVQLGILKQFKKNFITELITRNKSKKKIKSIKVLKTKIYKNEEYD